MDELVLNAVNSSMATLIDATTLVAILRGERDPGDLLGHLEAFFAEVPAEAADEFVNGHRIPYAAVARAYALVQPRMGETRADVDDWLAAVASPPR